LDFLRLLTPSLRIRSSGFSPISPPTPRIRVPQRTVATTGGAPRRGPRAFQLEGLYCGPAPGGHPLVARNWRAASHPPSHLGRVRVSCRAGIVRS
jgi:hypothetical protein